MKKIFFAALMLCGLAGLTNAQTSAARVSTQKKEVIKPAGTVGAVTSTTNKSSKNTKTNTPAGPSQKLSAANIGKHKKAHHKAKKPAKKS